MSIPKTYKAFRRSTGSYPLHLESTTEQLHPTLCDDGTLPPNKLLLHIRAISLNYRDIAMLNGSLPGNPLVQGIPASDCAAEVIAIGPNVSKFKIGDRVSPIFDLNALNGTEIEKATLGGDVDGVLREFAVFDESVLVKIPGYLSWEEAACIPVAGTTAWTCLDMPNEKEGTVLLQGTGGVSIFALLLCLSTNLKIIITSSSNEKLSKIKALAPAQSESEAGPDSYPIQTINYKDHPDWENEVKRLTNGRGVDIVIETGGPNTMVQSINSLVRRGSVALIGILGGLGMEMVPNYFGPLFGKSATIRAIFVGSKIDQENLCEYLSQHEISLKPLLDEKRFSFEDSQKAFDYLSSGQHMGKVVITV